MLKDLQSIVYKFMEREQVTMKQALLQSSLGMASKAGSISEIVRGVVYNDYPYTDERKKQNKEHLGEMLFYWLMLTSTTGANPDEIISEYISSYVQKHKITKDSEQVSITEMLKYIKETEKATPSLSSMKLREKIK